MTIDIGKYGPWALVTGAAGGQGQEYARHLAADGFNTILVDINLAPMEKLRDELLAQYKVEIKAAQVDLSKEDAVEQIIAAVGDEDIGLVISNAGFGYKAIYEDVPYDMMMSYYYVNTRVPMQLMYKMVPCLKNRGRGGIILVGSMEGETHCPFSAVYGATKAFIHKLGLSLYGELEGTNVDILVLAPGATNTDAHETAGLKPEQAKSMMKSPVDVTRMALQSLGKVPFLLTGDGDAERLEQMRTVPMKDAILGTARHLARYIETARPGAMTEYFKRFS